MTRSATVRTRHAAPETVLRAVEPDNTEQMRTRVEADAVVTEIERPTTGGLRSTVDDYVVNVTVADRTATIADRYDTHE